MVTFKFINFSCLNAKYLSHAFLPRKRVKHFPQIFLPEALSGAWVLKGCGKNVIDKLSPFRYFPTINNKKGRSEITQHKQTEERTKCSR